MTNTKTPFEEYAKVPLNKQDLNPDPISQFALWFDQAKANQEFEPSAMTLATVNKQFDVSARMLLLKGFDQEGFVFFTNYMSPKSKYLQEVPKAAMVFWWPKCQRQVRITGNVVRTSAKESDVYFNQRPKESRIAAIISEQSSVIPDRDYLIEKFETFEKENDDKITRPASWGGFVLQHQTIEFWQGRTHRLHDRFLYTKKGEHWIIEQLSP